MRVCMGPGVKYKSRNKYRYEYRNKLMDKKGTGK